MTLKRLRAMRESADEDKTEWRQDKGIQDPLAKEMSKIARSYAKQKRASARLGKKFRKG